MRHWGSKGLARGMPCDYPRSVASTCFPLVPAQAHLQQHALVITQQCGHQLAALLLNQRSWRPFHCSAAGQQRQAGGSLRWACRDGGKSGAVRSGGFTLHVLP